MNPNLVLFINLDSLKEFIGSLGPRDWPTGLGTLIGLGLFFLIFKTGKFVSKEICCLLAAGLFAGAYWWHGNK